jgi:hypothetical protein
MKSDNTTGDPKGTTHHEFRNLDGTSIESTNDHDADTTEASQSQISLPGTSRRTVLQGVAGISGLSLFSGGAAALPGLDSSSGVLSEAEGAGKADPYTLAQYRAVSDAMVPETPELAEKIGEEHRPGGLDIELERFLIYSFNSFVPLVAAPGVDATTGINLRFAEQFAATMDAGAILLIATGRNEEPPVLTRFPFGGPFAKLSRKDRFRAINLLENQDLTIDTASLLGGFAEAMLGSLGADALLEEITGALTPGMSVDSLAAVDNELLNAAPGTSLDSLANTVTESLAGDTPTDVGEVVDNIGDQLRRSPLNEDGLLDKVTNYPGFIKFQIFGVNSFSQFGYYTEWSGYGDTKIACPSERVFGGVEAVQSYDQTKYPGPARGYAAFRGYEVEEFKEGDY